MVVSGPETEAVRAASSLWYGGVFVCRYLFINNELGRYSSDWVARQKAVSQARLRRCKNNY